MLENFTTLFVTQVNATDLERAFSTIRAKRPDLDRLFLYANGPQPLKYSTARLTEAFGNITASFTINWMSLVIDSALDRIQLSGFDTDDKSVNDKLDLLFDELHLDIEADKAHQAALTTSQAYIIVWKGEDGVIEAYYNDPRLCQVFYDPEHPRIKTYAAKWFNHIDQTQEITLYYTDRIEHWVSQKITSGIDKASAFELQEVEANPYGVIPVFELKSPGEIFKVLSIQDGINKAFADGMIVAEFSTAPQRYVISNADPGTLKNSPNEIWWLPSSDGQGQQTSAGQFPQAELGGFWESIEKMTNSIAIITRTPKYYFMSTGANVSGEALLAMEAPLVAKCQKRQREFGVVWVDIATFLAQLEGVTIEPADVNVLWEKVESTQPLTEAQTRLASINSGINLRTILRDEGWSEADLDEMDEDQRTMDAARKTLAQSVLNDLRTKQEQTNPQDVTADSATPDNIASDKGLNGAQITAAIQVLTNLSAGITAAEVAAELLISLGIEEERVTRMIAATEKIKLDSPVIPNAAAR